MSKMKLRGEGLAGALAAELCSTGRGSMKDDRK